ncbi:MAG: thioesterase family protein [Sphingopyxis sp.]|nr:thioesterase family protein [Sphingopyxis sp.]
MTPPPIGLSFRSTIMVDAKLTVPQIPLPLGVMANMPPVFATAYMIAFVEATCIEALAPYLGEGEATVGTHVDISHAAATPVGMRVTAEVVLEALERRKLRFRVCCSDEASLIGEGFHERAVIDGAAFSARTSAKLASGGVTG